MLDLSLLVPSCGATLQYLEIDNHCIRSLEALTAFTRLKCLNASVVDEEDMDFSLLTELAPLKHIEVGPQDSHAE